MLLFQFRMDPVLVRGCSLKRRYLLKATMSLSPNQETIMGKSVCILPSKNSQLFYGEQIAVKNAVRICFFCLSLNGWSSLKKKLTDIAVHKIVDFINCRIFYNFNNLLDFCKYKNP